MKNFNKFSLAFIFAIIFTFTIINLSYIFAATTPTLNSADTFGVLSSTYTNTIVGTTINGDIGYTTSPAMKPTLNGNLYVADSIYNQAGIDQGTILTNLNNQGCSFTFAPGAIDLSTDTTHGPIGVYSSGVYCITGAATIGVGGIILDGTGTFIFRINGALNTVANSSISVINGASVCDIFWIPTQATTFGANTTFIGNIIDPAGATLGANSTLLGKILAFGGTVTTDKNIITNSICTIPSTPFIIPTLPKVNNDNSLGNSGSGSGSGGAKVDDCPDGDNSSSYYDGICEAQKIIEVEESTGSIIPNENEIISNEDIIEVIPNENIVEIIPTIEKTPILPISDVLPIIPTDDIDNNEIQKNIITPGFPNAGINSENNNFARNIIILIGIIVLVGTSLVLIYEKQK